MGTIIPAGYANARFVFACAGVNDPMGFSLGIQSATIGTALGLATEMANLFNDNIWVGGSNAGVDWTWLRTDVTLMSESGPVIASSSTPIAGSLSAPTVPPNCCILVSKNTELGGKRNRGRLYLVAGLLFESEVSSAGTVSGASVNTHTDKWNNLREEANVAGIDLMLFHSSGVTTPTEITGFQVSSVIGTQRRRLR